MRPTVVLSAVLALSVAAATTAHAASLAAQLDDLIRRRGLQPTDVIVPTLAESVARGADFPTAASTPTFVIEFSNQEAEVPTSVARPLSPVVVDAAQSVKGGTLQIGGTFLWSEFNRIDGALLSNTQAPFVFRGQTPEGDPLFIPGTLKFDRFGIENVVLAGLATYGITDRWDV